MHRVVGLALAAFLIVAALSGAILVWRQPLDRALNPALFRASDVTQPQLPAARLETLLREQYPPARFRVLDLPAAGATTARVAVRDWPDVDPASRRTNEAYVDPRTGRLLGVRSTVNPAFTRLEFVPWLRQMHYSLMLKRTGMLIMGNIAVVWFLDCFVGLALTLPRGPGRLRKWRSAWRLHGPRLNYDLHRATGLWLWPMMVLLAFSGVYLNLTREVYEPVMRTILSPLPAAAIEATRELVDGSMFPLHTGDGFGLPWHLLLSLAGLLIGLSVITGLVTAVRRLRRRP